VTAPLFEAGELRRLDRLAILARRAVRGEAGGERTRRRAGAGLTFEDHRDYVPGDDLRHVDWNAYARLGDLVVKRFRSEEDVSVLLCVDRSASMEGAKSREARRVAGAVGHVALRRRDSVALAWLPRVPERPVEVFRGEAGPAALSARLAEVPVAGATSHAKDLRSVLPAVPRRGPALLVSDFFDAAGAVTGLARLAAHGFETTALHVLDPADAWLPAGESVRCVDRESGETVDLDVTAALAESVQRSWRRRAERLRAWCAARGVGWQRVDVGRPLWDVLREMVRGRVVLAA
jgi:uncharacterized protein (DUF58 family)